MLAKSLVLLVAVPAVAIGLYWYLTFPNVAGLAKINPRSTAFIEARSREGARLLERGLHDPLQLKATGTPISPPKMAPAVDAKGRPVQPHHHEAFLGRHADQSRPVRRRR